MISADKQKPFVTITSGFIVYLAITPVSFCHFWQKIRSNLRNIRHIWRIYKVTKMVTRSQNALFFMCATLQRFYATFATFFV